MSHHTERTTSLHSNASNDLFMNRRDFVSLSSLGALCGSAMPKCARAAMSSVSALSLPNDIADITAKPIDTKVKVKPLCVSLVHTCSYMGPCRAQGLTPEEETPKVNQDVTHFVNLLKQGISKEAVLLEPALLTHDETFALGPQEWKKLQPDAAEVDLYISGGWPGRAPGLERFGKPVVALGQGPQQFDIAAGFQNRGIEGFVAYDVAELNQLVSLLRVRKALQQTGLLLVTDRRGLPAMCELSSIPLPVLKEKLGIRTQVVSYREFFDNMQVIAESRAGQDRARAITEKVVSQAAKVHMDRNNILTDAIFYLTVQSFLNRYGLNAFAIDCIELCGSQIPNQRKFTPCLTHTLLKDQGIPSACENDINAFGAMALAGYTCRRSVYMGNPSYSRDKGLLKIGHDVPGLKMKGLDQPDLPYEIRNFTEGGWGTTFRYDFSRDKGQPVVLSRLDPTASKLLLAKGTIEDGVGFDEVGCTLRALVRIPNLMDLFHAHAGFGNHLTMTYGDCARDLRRVAEFLKIGVVEVA
jgi:L-fucose isomerase-like protein